MHLCKVRCRGLIVHEDQLLVARHSHSNRYFSLPGGHLDPGESPIDCINRELQEELGVIPDVGRLCTVYSFTDANRLQSIEFFFQINNPEAFRSTERLNSSHAHEIAEVLWISRSDMVELLPKKILELFQNDMLVTDSIQYLKE